MWVRNSVSLVPGTERVPQFIMALSEDITEHNESEEGLRGSQFNARMIVDGIPGLVARTSPAGEVEVVNRPLLEYFGKNLEEVRNWQFTDAIHPDIFLLQ